MDPDGEPAGNDAHEYRAHGEEYHKGQRGQDAVDDSVPGRSSHIKARSEAESPRSPKTAAVTALSIGAGAERRARSSVAASGGAVTRARTRGPRTKSWVSVKLRFRKRGMG